MTQNDKKSLLKQGIWIQEQQGVLTMGSLDPHDSKVIELSPELTATIAEFEQDMTDALYGGKSTIFEPGKINVKKLLESVAKSFDTTGIQISISCLDHLVISGDYDGFFCLFSGIVANSINHELKGVDRPAIHISVSVVADTLCMIYRDSGTGSGANRLKKEINYIRDTLKGEVSQKSTPGKGTYFDIVIGGIS